MDRLSDLKKELLYWSKDLDYNPEPYGNYFWFKVNKVKQIIKQLESLYE